MAFQVDVEVSPNGEEQPFPAPDSWQTVSTMSDLRLEAGVTESPYYLRRQRQARARRIRRLGLLGVLALVLGAIGAAIVYAGSPATIADGIKVDSVDVGGLSQAEAALLLERRAASSRGKPVTFTVDGRAFKLRSSQIGLKALDFLRFEE